MFSNRRVLAFLACGVVLFACGAGLLATWALTGAKPGQLSWDPPTFRKSVMSFGYKVYANPQVDEGKYFLSKIVLKNTGGRPIRDLTVSYQVPDYIPWTTPEVAGELPAGTSVVKLYYPKFPERITHLANQTTASLEIKLQWREEGGSTKEQVLRDDFTIYGVNEVQYSDLPADDILTWYDQWNLAQFVVCMVTPNDPIVKEYAAAITKRIGGTLAGATQDPDQIVELMKATYDYMRETGMRYASAEGVPVSIGDARTLVQTVRLPRDVITTNNGLCIELAILWASILDQLGCQTCIVMIPGHAFTVVVAGDKYYPVECTAITPKAVGATADVPFEKAMEIALGNLQKQQYKIFFPVQKFRGDGYASPELPDVEVDKIKEMLASREREASDAAKNVAQNQPPPAPPAQDAQQGTPAQNQPPPTEQGMSHFEHSAGLVSFSYPDSWKVLQPPTQLGITFRVYDPSTAMGMDVVEVPRATSASEALKVVGRAFARTGGRIRVEDSKMQGDLTVVLGHTTGSAGENEWYGVFRPVRGGVIGVAAGSPATNFQANRQALLKLLDTVRFP
jgi:hypothetical protein